MASLSPTFQGYIDTTFDALLLFEACYTGILSPIARRPNDKEKEAMTRSGNVFIYKKVPGFLRWSDGLSWSPSRWLDNFLVYRELDGSVLSKEKRKALRQEGMTSSQTPARRKLVSSLVANYPFKTEGLVKKTITVCVGGTSLTLVSYYTIDDVESLKFVTPSKHPQFMGIAPRTDLVKKQNFRSIVYGHPDNAKSCNFTIPSKHPQFMYTTPPPDRGNNQNSRSDDFTLLSLPWLSPRCRFSTSLS